jgi:FO synthase
VATAEAGRTAGCKEALFTLGDRPEDRYPVARAWLEERGYRSTLDYLRAVAVRVIEETGLLPHLNPGVMSYEDVARLKHVSASMGLMLEQSTERLLEKGMPHHGSPDKVPAVRLRTIEDAGRMAVPFTTGILVGIGETPDERAASLLAIRDLHRRYRHVQEVIVQNFRAKPGTRMHDHPEPDDEEFLATVATARIVLGPRMNVQAPPNLSDPHYPRLLDAGINDWGGVSPVTPDHVNPEAPWPALDDLRTVTEERGFRLLERLAVYPSYCATPAARAEWLAPALRPAVLDSSDAEGYRRTDEWYSGADNQPPDDATVAIAAARARAWRVPGRVTRSSVANSLGRAADGEGLSEDEITLLFSARGAEVERLYSVADDVRRQIVGDEVTYVVNRNINYTNMCYFRCGFCAFSKGPKSLNLRGDPYLLTEDEVARRAVEAWEKGATEVCMQGGIHGSFTGDDYVRFLRAVKRAVPEMHVHAFTALEVWQGASTLGVSIHDFLLRLRDAGLSTLPGTAAEILDDEIRAVICPDKITTSQWCEVHRIAHSLGLKSNATIMFGTVESPRSWARHLIEIRKLDEELTATGDTGGLFEFVPLPFVHMAAPIYLKGGARRGPTFDEALKMHAVARLALQGRINNIQVSWVKMGIEGSKRALQVGANDLGGTLMNENISRAAGATHGQELGPQDMEELIRSIGRQPRRRTTLYASAPAH